MPRGSALPIRRARSRFLALENKNVLAQLPGELPSFGLQLLDVLWHRGTVLPVCQFLPVDAARLHIIAHQIEIDSPFLFRQEPPPETKNPRGNGLRECQRLRARSGGTKHRVAIRLTVFRIDYSHNCSACRIQHNQVSGGARGAKTNRPVSRDTERSNKPSAPPSLGGTRPLKGTDGAGKREFVESR